MGVEKMKFKSQLLLIVLIIIMFLGIGCSSGSSGDDDDSGDTTEDSFTLTSSAFNNNKTIPDKYACEVYNDGENISPPLSWTNVPSNAQSLVLLMYDSDASDFAHWAVYDIPTTEEGLPEDTPSSSFEQGINDFLTAGYGGPCPPPLPLSEHSYYFNLIAVSVETLNPDTDITGIVTYDNVETAAEANKISETTLIGKYQASVF